MFVKLTCSQLLCQSAALRPCEATRKPQTCPEGRCAVIPRAQVLAGHSEVAFGNSGVYLNPSRGWGDGSGSDVTACLGSWGHSKVGVRLIPFVGKFFCPWALRGPKLRVKGSIVVDEVELN